jgi:DNA topoisomerase-1
MDEECPECSKPLSIRLGRNGRFIGCTDFPACKYTRNLNDDGEQPEAEVVEGRKCPKCESDLVIKSGRYGKFIGCSGYPDCKHIEPLEKPEDTEVECPECNKATIMKRKSRNGKIFYSCSAYPKCKYAIWNEPLKEKCPECDWPILSIKTTKRSGTEVVCPQKECSYKRSHEPEDTTD